MQISGKPILNCRSLKINGYDCFVNLSKYTMDLQSYKELISYNDPATSSHTKIFTLDNAHTKFSHTSLLTQANDIVRFWVNNGSNLLNSSSSSYTLSYWVYAKSYNYTSSTHCANPDYCASLGATVGNSNPLICYNNNVKAFCYHRPGNDYYLIKGSSGNFLDGNWHHIANVIQNNTHWMLFYDGVKMLDYTASGIESTVITNGFIRSYYGTQWIDDFVVIADQALWNSNFTPPTSYLLDDEYNLTLPKIRRRNIIYSDTDVHIVIPDDPLKVN